MRGLSVSVYRTGSTDCTNGGVTRPGTKLHIVLFDELIDRGNMILEECAARPQFVCLRLVRRRIGGRDYVHAEDMFMSRHGGRTGAPMFGGNFIYTTDSRLRDICPYPIPVHDRFESAEEAPV